MSVAHLLGWEDGIEVVAEASSCGELIDRVEATSPHVAVVDVMICGGPADGLVDALRRLRPGIGIVVLAVYEETHSRQQTAAAGVDGRLLKDCSPAEMVAAVRRAAMAPESII